jgi:glycosyltransferase involved in cell wall biosynthesis
MRILHVLGKLGRGGVETWLVQMLRELDGSSYKCDFLVHSEEAGAYDAEVLRLGARIIPCMAPDRPLTYCGNFFRVLKQYGPYDVVHSHVHYFSAFVLFLARVGGVPVRIAHSHTDLRSVEQGSSLHRKLYCYLMRRLLPYSASGGFAVSSQSGDCLFPSEWANSRRWKLAYLGIDLARFRGEIAGSQVRRQLGLERASIVVGHVGRVDEHKNQAFIVDIAAEMLKHDPDAMFLLIGQGPWLPMIKEKIADRGLSGHFVLAGERPDVPVLLRGAMDVFVFPSIREGLPVTLLEAQAAGLRCLISDIVTGEADVMPELITRMSLQQSPSQWALTLAGINCEPRVPSSIACRRMESRSIRASCRELVAFYDTLASSMTAS